MVLVQKEIFNIQMLKKKFSNKEFSVKCGNYSIKLKTKQKHGHADKMK